MMYTFFLEEVMANFRKKKGNLVKRTEKCQKKTSTARDYQIVNKRD